MVTDNGSYFKKLLLELYLEDDENDEIQKGQQKMRKKLKFT